MLDNCYLVQVGLQFEILNALLHKADEAGGRNVLFLNTIPVDHGLIPESEC